MVPGFIPPNVQDFIPPAFLTLEGFCQPISSECQGYFETFWFIHHSSQFSVIRKLAGCALCPTNLIINRDIVETFFFSKQPLLAHASLKYTNY